MLANSILAFTESKMSSALGQYGFAKNAEAAHQVCEAINGSDKPLSNTEIFSATASYFSRIEDLTDVISKLIAAQKIKQVRTQIGNSTNFVYVPNKIDSRLLSSPYVDLSLLEEAGSM
jgi:hypothetical protein